MPIVDKLRGSFSRYLHAVEGLIYIIVGGLLAIAAAIEIFQAGALMWRSLVGQTPADYGLVVLDRLLLVLMLVELLHTVRMSVRSEELVMEPFLIVGLIASIRRVLVITMQAAKLTEQGQQVLDVSFKNTMIELVLLGFLIVVFVLAIYLLRKSSRREDLMTN